MLETQMVFVFCPICGNVDIRLVIGWDQRDICCAAKNAQLYYEMAAIVDHICANPHVRSDFYAV
jgi:hypothetical protein